MYVLDANVVSELMRPAPDPVIERWVAERPTRSPFLTAVTEAELRFDLAIMPKGKRWEGLSAAFDRMLRSGFANRVPPFDSCAARLCRDWLCAKPHGTADRGSRLPDRRDRSGTRHVVGDTQHSGLQGRGVRDLRPLEGRMNGTAAAYSYTEIETLRSFFTIEMGLIGLHWQSTSFGLLQILALKTRSTTASGAGCSERSRRVSGC